ncbi:MAG: helix-turn-helix transcriptional regulator [Hydrogenophaga sp.]
MWTSALSPDASPGRTCMGLLPQGVEPAFLLRVIDEIDYGLLVLNEQGRLLHTNHLARSELASRCLIDAREGTLLGANAGHSEKIQFALEQALRGHRRLLLLRERGRELSMAFIPLTASRQDEVPGVLVLLSRQSTSDSLSVRLYARAHGLSSTEEAVMMWLCRGLSIPDIAREHGVAPSTVRSQIKSLREKTGSSSIRALLQKINSLPPIVPALRTLSATPTMP